MSPSGFDNRKYWERRFADGVSLGTVGEIGLREPYIRWLYRVRRAVFRRRVAPLAAGQQWSVADIGPGTGFYVQLWHEAGVEKLLGIDITEKAVATLAERYPTDQFIRADISRDGLDDIEGLDAVSAFDVLFHIVEDAGFNRAVRTIAGMLRAGGYFFLTDVFQRTNTFDEGHQVGRTLETITGALAEAGFDVVERRPAFWLMTDPTDSDSRLLRGLYFRIHRSAARSDALAWILGCALYPFELAGTRLLRTGPSIELLIARKR